MKRYIMNNQSIELSTDKGVLRVAIMDGDISINGNSNLPKGVLLYYLGVVNIKGTGVIKFNG